MRCDKCAAGSERAVCRPARGTGADASDGASFSKSDASDSLMRSGVGVSCSPRTVQTFTCTDDYQVTAVRARKAVHLGDSDDERENQKEELY